MKKYSNTVIIFINTKIRTHGHIKPYVNMSKVFNTEHFMFHRFLIHIEIVNKLNQRERLFL